MYRKLIGAFVGLAMMGMAGTANALVINSLGPNTMAFAEYDLGGAPVTSIHITWSATGDLLGAPSGETFKTDLFDFVSPTPIDSVTASRFSPFFDLGFSFTAPVPNQGFFKITALSGSANLNTLASLFVVSDPNFQLPLNVSSTAPSIPKPSTLALFATGLALLAFLGWRRRGSVQVKAA